MLLNRKMDEKKKVVHLYIQWKKVIAIKLWKDMDEP